MWKGIVNWHKPAHQHAARVSAACEYLVYGCNGADDKGPKVPGFYSESAPHSTKRQHQTEKPAGLVAHVLQVLEGRGRVVDPFAGAGVVGVVCARLGHDYQGCEIDPHYARVAKRRIRAAGGL